MSQRQGKRHYSPEQLQERAVKRVRTVVHGQRRLVGIQPFGSRGEETLLAFLSHDGVLSGTVVRIEGKESLTKGDRDLVISALNGVARKNALAVRAIQAGSVAKVVNAAALDTDVKFGGDVVRVAPVGSLKRVPTQRVVVSDDAETEFDAVNDICTDCGVERSASGACNCDQNSVA